MGVLEDEELKVVKKIWADQKKVTKLSGELKKLKDEYQHCTTTPRFIRTDQPIEGNDESSRLMRLKVQGCPTVKRVYPPVTSTRKFNWIAAFLPTIICFVVMLLFTILYIISGQSFILGVFVRMVLFAFTASFGYVLYYILYKHPQLKQEDVKSFVNNSVEYRNTCAQLNAQYDAQDAALKAKYENEIRTLENAKNEKAKTLSEQIRKKENEFNDAKKVLDASYANCGQISKEYRNNDALDFLYNYMNSQKTGIEEAVVAYQNELRRRENERIIAQQQESQRRMEQWDREYEAQERERERAYQEKYGKKDLLGSSVCLKRKQENFIDFEHSCRHCPQARYCTRA